MPKYERLTFEESSSALTVDVVEFYTAEHVNQLVFDSKTVNLIMI